MILPRQDSAVFGRSDGFGYVAAIVPAGFFALFVARLSPDLTLLGDSAELVTAAALWGVPHAPGYPLFTAIGHAFAAIPLFTVPWRVHLASAVFHAGAVAAAMAAVHALTRSRVAAATAGFALGISRSFLLGSLYAEVFPLNDFFFACLMALALHARRAPARRVGSLLYALAICGGLAAGHHMMIALAAPALVLLARGPTAAFVRADRRRAPLLLAAALTPLVAAYALVPLAAARHPYLSWGGVHDAASLFAFVTRQAYGGLLSPVRHASTEPAPLRVASAALLLTGSMGPVVLAGAALGVVDRLRREPLVGASLLLAAVVTGPVFAWANALDTSSSGALAFFERFTTMSHVAVAIAFGAGVEVVRSASRRSRVVEGLAATALLTWGGVRVRAAQGVDLHADRQGIAFAHALLLTPPDGSLVLLSGDQPIDAELYVCGVERLCGERVIFAPGTLSMPWKMAEVRERHPDVVIPWAAGPALRRTHEIVAAAGGRPVFVYPDLLAKDPALASFAASPEGLLLRVWPPGSTPGDDGVTLRGQGGGRSMSR